MYEDAMDKFLREECYTTPEEMDPTKPLLVRDGMVEANPGYDRVAADRKSHDREVERRKANLGTSFFLNFDPLCHVHQQDGPEGDRMRQEIIKSLRLAFLIVFGRQFPDDNQPPLEAIGRKLRVALCPHPQGGFNNGEVYLWLPGFALTEEFIFMMMKALKAYFEENPVRVRFEGEDYEAFFYGWGFRYY